MTTIQQNSVIKITKILFNVLTCRAIKCFWLYLIKNQLKYIKITLSYPLYSKYFTQRGREAD
jgi:hypothetical protein